MNKRKWSFKKKFSILLTSILLVLIAVTGILGYMAYMDSANNRMVIGGNRIQLEEEFIPPKELVPGISIKKDVKVTNTGTSDCYVRVMAVFSDSDMGRLCNVDWQLEKGWIYNDDDGYWYYPDPIEEGESTPSLFTKITIKEKYDFNGDQIDETIPENIMKDVDMIVYAESYQSSGFSNYEEAWANFKKNKDN